MPEQSLTLYEVEQQYLALCNTEEMVPEEQEEEFRKELGEALRTAAQKRDRVAHFLRICEHHESAIDAEIDRLEKLKGTWKRGRERMEQYVIRVIEEIGVDRKLHGETVTLSVQRNPSTVDITDSCAVPKKYKRVTVTLPAVVWDQIRSIHVDNEGSDMTFEDNPLIVQERVIGSESVVVDKVAIKGAWKAKREVPGARKKDGDLRLVLR